MINTEAINTKAPQIIVPVIRQKNELHLKNLALKILKDYDKFSDCSSYEGKQTKIYQLMVICGIELCQDLSLEHVKMLAGIQDAAQKTNPLNSKKQFIFLLHKCLEAGRASRSRKARMEDWVDSPLNGVYFPTKAWLLGILVRIFFHPKKTLSCLIPNFSRKPTGFIYN